MLIPADMPHPPGAVAMTEVWWDANGATTEGPVPGGRGAISFLDAHEVLVGTLHVQVGDAVHTSEDRPTTGGERA